MKHILLSGILLFSIIIPGISQKVKYKDLFILLKAENYTDADRYLRVYLKNEPDHPHANYAMGRMLQSYLAEQDLLNNSARVIELADSSLLYFNKALDITNEKYIKKHDDDYYVEFKRRDMRTAKFTVKISDVQLDVELRMEAVNNFKSDVAKLILHFNSAISLYDSTLNYYELIKEKSRSANALYFNSGPDELQLFRKLAERYDSCIYNFQTFQSLMKGMGKNAPKQKVVEKPIETYPLEGIVKPDFYGETVEFLNFVAWANATKDIVLKQVYPLKKRMISFDLRLKELHDRILVDSLDARSEIFRLATENVARDIVDFDNKSLPAAIYNYRIAEINYHSAVNYWYKVVEDTSHIGVKIDVLEDMNKQQRGNTKLLEGLIEANNEEERLIFREYITARYQDDNGMAEFVRLQIADVEKDSTLLYTWMAEAGEEDKYTYWHNGSIALEAGAQIGNADSLKYSTVLIAHLSDRDLGFYAWMERPNSLSLTFSISPSSRKLDTLYSVPINSNVVAEADVLNLKFLSDSLTLEQMVWVMNTTEPDDNEEYTVQVFTTHLADGIGWNKEFSVQDIPNAVKYHPESQMITVLGKNEETILLLDEQGEAQEILETEGGE